MHTVEPLYNGHLWGTMFWPLYRGGLYTEVAFTQTVHLGPRCLHGRYIAAGLYSEVVVNRGSTVYII